MKVVILYRPESEHATSVETFVHDFQKRHPSTKVELINIDHRDGIAMASLYEVMDFPAILVLAVDGRLQQFWQGKQLPLIDEVAGYAMAY